MDIQQKLEQLKIVEQSLQTILAQKQAIQSQLEEINNAIQELEKLEENKKVYKLIGNLLLEVDKNKVLQELKERKEILEIRLQSLNKQEEKLREKLQKLQEEIMKYSKA